MVHFRKRHLLVLLATAVVMSACGNNAGSQMADIQTETDEAEEYDIQYILKRIDEGTINTYGNAYGNAHEYMMYEGYLDELKDNIYAQTKYDLDGDGLTDRIYRTLSQDYTAVYRIEFGNGDLLETAPLSSSYVCFWKFTDVVGDDTPELVLNCYEVEVEPYIGLYDIQIYIKKGTGYEKLELPDILL
jgi:hypothetical protein